MYVYMHMCALTHSHTCTHVYNFHTIQRALAPRAVPAGLTEAVKSVVRTFVQ